jgi:hypothetical protein
MRVTTRLLHTGKMSAAVASHGEGFVIFGACARL